MRLGSVGSKQDGVQAHAAGAGRPVGAGAVTAQAAEFAPGLAAVGGLENGGILDSGVDRVGVGKRRFEMPDALEFPGVGRAVVPLVRAGVAFVGELVADRLPGLAAIAGTLDQLSEPAAGLRSVDAIGVRWGPLQVIHFPAAEVRAGDLPLLALAVRSEDERSFASAHEDTDATHFLASQLIIHGTP